MIWLKRLAVVGSALFLAGVAVWVCLPRPPLLEGISFSRCYLDRNGVPLRYTLAKDGIYRIHIPLAKISPIVIEATLLHEDRYYRFHPGMNPVALGKAFWNEIFGGHRRFGASTISMQLARLRFHLQTRTWSGKCVQIFRALQLERHYSKDEMLEAYLNLAPYGRNIEGIGTASMIYYGKAPEHLTLAEALTLSVIPQSPTRRTPHPEGENKALQDAREVLFSQWLAVHPEDEKERALLQMALQVRSLQALPFRAPHFVDRVNQRPGLPGVVKTTIDSDLQKVLEKEVTAFIRQHSDAGVHNAAALLVDASNMDVVAAVGSANYSSKEIDGQVNGVTMRRSPGSALKPLLYALAMDQGIIQPHSLMRDMPSSFAGYNPENFDREFIGPIQADAALRQSRNIPAVWLASQLKGKSLYQLLQESGVKDLRNESAYGLTIALGSTEVSMEDLARLYAMLANRGNFKNLRMTSDDPVDAGRSLIRPEATFLVLDMLKPSVRPGAATRCEGRRDGRGAVAWKTGTSWSFRDAWSVAVFDHYVMVVWVGNFDGKGNEIFVGKKTAAPLLFQMIDAVRLRRPVPDGLAAWEDPTGLNLEKCDLCSVTGELENDHCPHTFKGWFIPGVSPIRTCTVHQQIYIDPQTGKRLRDPDGKPGVRQELCECWPSDMMELFRKAGLPRRSPPPYADEENRNTVGNTFVPVIRSPQEGVTYAIPLGGDEQHSSLALKASVHADARKIYWFAGASYLGEGKPDEVFPWKPNMAGKYQITVADDLGRASSRTIEVETVP